MQYSANAILVVMMTIVIACGARPTGTEVPAETNDPLPTATSVSTQTLVPSTSLTPSPPPTVTPIPSLTATPVAVETPRPVVTTSPEPAGEGPQLKMALIRASASEVEQLRKMPLEIIRVRPVTGSQTPTTKRDFLQSEFIVEAVVPTGLLAKLKELGFDVTEVP